MSKKDFKTELAAFKVEYINTLKNAKELLKVRAKEGNIVFKDVPMIINIFSEYNDMSEVVSLTEYFDILLEDGSIISIDEMSSISDLYEILSKIEC